MIAELLAVKGCLLAIYYCPDEVYEVYRMSIVDIDEATPRRRIPLCLAPTRGRVLEFDDIFFSIKMATNQAKSIVRVLTR